MQKEFSLERTVDLIDGKFDSYALMSLMEYIRIPNLSRQFDPQWATNGLLQRAAEHIRNWVMGLGLVGVKSEVIVDRGYSPIVITEIEGTLPFTILYYGHFDKQPAFTGWTEGFGPNNPVIKDNKLYGRGGADDGYSTYSAMLSIWALQQQGVPLPHCVMVTEGDEESGNHIDHYLSTLKNRIGTPTLIFCLDSGTIDYESLSFTTSLRGLIGFEMKVKIMDEGMHSGDASGVVPSTFRIMRELLSRIEDPQSGEMIEQLQVNIPPERYSELFVLSQKKSKEFQGHYHLVKNAKTVHQNPLKGLIARNWRSQMEVTGASGFPPAENAGNVLRPETVFKISIRTPPTLKCEAVAKEIKKILTTNVPYGAHVEITNIDCCGGWNAPYLEDYLQKAVTFASGVIFESDPINFGEGGSIPLMSELQSIFPKAQFLITGVLGPQANAHGPNEFLHLPYCKKLTCAMSLILQQVSNHLLGVVGRKQ